MAAWSGCPVADQRAGSGWSARAAKAAQGGRTSTAIRLDSELHLRLQREAERRDVSVNWLITKAVERALPAWEEQNLDD